jgi:hypothetical protein
MHVAPFPGQQFASWREAVAVGNADHDPYIGCIAWASLRMLRGRLFTNSTLVTGTEFAEHERRDNGRYELTLLYT